MIISITFRSLTRITKRKARKFWDNALEFREVTPQTYERVHFFPGNEGDLLNLTIAAVHNIFDIARECGIDGVEIMEFSAVREA